MKVLVDTNVLLYSAKGGFDLFSELKKFGASQILIPENVIEELKMLSKSAEKGSDKKSAKLAIQIINYSGITPVKIGSGHTDDVIVSYSKTEGNLVMTNDSELKKRLTEANVRVISLSRNKKIITS